MSDKENPNQDLTPFEAALAGLQPRPERLDPRWRALLAKEVSQKAATRIGQPMPREISPCSVASDHVFACVYCGAPGPRAAPARRWAWPAAFSAMTVVAASLLAMLLVRSEPQIALQGSRAAGSANGILTANFQSPPRSPDFEKLCYLGIRRQVLLHGVESWKFPASTPTRPSQVEEPPLFYREHLERLLKQLDSAD